METIPFDGALWVCMAFFFAMGVTAKSWWRPNRSKADWAFAVIVGLELAILSTGLAAGWAPLLDQLRLVFGVASAVLFFALNALVLAHVLLSPGKAVPEKLDIKS